MDLLTRKQFDALLGPADEVCVSLYLPTHRTMPETTQDPIRLKNLLQTAKRGLQEKAVNSRAVQRFLGPVHEWLDDTEFWRHQSDGLAVFLTESSHRRFRLPRQFEEQVRVDDHFYLNPLLPLLQSNGTFYVLAVSQNTCRLFIANRDTIQELDKANLPINLRSALGWWRERELNLHSMQRKPQSRGGDDTAIYHGHEEDATEVDLQAYFRRIDAGVIEALRGERAPLVFAGVESLFPIYADVNSFKELCDEPVRGNPDDASPEELHRQAWALVRPKFERRQHTVLKDYEQQASQGRATNDITNVLHAARDGLVETLVISEGAQLPGRFDAQTGNLEIGPGEPSEDLLDRAVLLTLKTSGEVLAVDSQSMPHDSVALALLRAPLSAVAP